MIGKQQKMRLQVFKLLIILTLISLGCGVSIPALSRSEPTPTRTPMPTFTPTAVGAGFVEIASIDTEPEIIESQEEQPVGEIVEPEVVDPSPTPLPPTPIPEPTATTPPADNTVTITIPQDMNVRGGPGTNYPVIGPGPAGSSSSAVGRNADNSWLQVEYPSANGTGWVYAGLVQVTGDLGTVAVVEAAAPPPVESPPEEASAPPPEPAVQYQFTPSAWHASENAAIVHFKGRIYDEGGNLVNGYSVYVTNGSWGTVSHPTGASHWYPDKGDGEWDVAGIELAQAQGWWWLSVVRYDCDFVSGFDAQCKNFTTLSEEIPVEVVTPHESVINADWTCHWDCDKGLYTEGYQR